MLEIEVEPEDVEDRRTHEQQEKPGLGQLAPALYRHTQPAARAVRKLARIAAVAWVPIIASPEQRIDKGLAGHRTRQAEHAQQHQRARGSTAKYSTSTTQVPGWSRPPASTMSAGTTVSSRPAQRLTATVWRRWQRASGLALARCR